MPNASMSFDNIFKTANIALRIIGSHPACVRNRNWKIKFIILILFKIFCSILLCYSIFVKDIQDERYADASKNTVMLLITVTVIFDYSVLLIHQRSIMGIIHTINEDYNLIPELTEKEKKIVLDYSEKGLKVCRLWYMASIICSTIFPLKAILLMVYMYYNKGEFKLVPMFDLSYPDSIDVNKNEPGPYVIFLSIYIIFAFYAALTFTGFDPVVPIFLLHACGQLDVTSQRILSVYNETLDEKQIEEKFKRIILKMQEIYRYPFILTRFIVIATELLHIVT